MQPASELILRAFRSEPGTRPATTSVGSKAASHTRAAAILLFNPPRDSLVFELQRSGAGDVTLFTQDFGDHRFFENAGISSQFGLLPVDQDLPRQVILFLPREKERLEFLLHFLAANMPAEGTLWLVGENKAGIKSAEPRLKHRFVQVQKSDSARHCVLYQAQQSIPGKAFAVQDYREAWTLPTRLGELQLLSLPGSFAHGRLDKGTALLLEFLQSPAGQDLRIKGKVLDFGCGVGVIGLFLKQQNPHISLDMLDSSASALESTGLSLLANGCEAKVFAGDGLNGLRNRYDWIISNPPFHQGIAADLNTVRQMIARAPALLGNRGRMLLVCNRHLRYEPWLDESFGACETVLANREFKVLLTPAPSVAAQRGKTLQPGSRSQR